MSCNRIIVIGMHRLSILFHYIVCNIHDIINRPDAVRRQPPLHPLRRRSDFDILYHPGSITWAEVCIFHCNLYIIMSILAISCCLNYRRNKFLSESSGSFPGDSQHTIAVHTIRSYLILKNHIVQPQRFYSALAYHSILRENVNSIFRRLRVHLTGRAKLFNRAHHTAGLDASKFSLFNPDTAGRHLSVMAAGHTSAVQHHRNLVALFHIRRSRHDLHRLCSHIYLADDQFVRVRMPLNRKNLANHDFFQICVHLLIALYLRA